MFPLVLQVALWGCPSADKSDDSAPVADSSDESGLPVGGLDLLSITMDNSDGYQMSTFQMWGFYDEPAPSSRWGDGWEYLSETLMEDGDCALVDTMPIHHCDPPCGEGWCADKNECVPYPTPHDAGDIRVTFGPTTLDLVPSKYGLYSTDDTIPDPPFAPGDLVVAVAEGGKVPRFRAEAVAPSYLEPPLDCSRIPVKGEDFTVTWTPADEGARIRWEMIAVYHAGNGPMVICETDDIGSLTVPASIVDAYMPARTPAETFQLTRFHRGSAFLGDGLAVWLEPAAQRVCW